MEGAERTVPVAILDAFAAAPFKGNPASVCFVGDQNPSDETLYAIASELNQVVTAFVVSKNKNYKEDSCFDLRWFTPTIELPLCGHATLAAAAAIFEIAENVHNSITFSTGSGELYARKKSDGFIDMSFPLNDPVKCSRNDFKDLAVAVLGEFEKELDEVWLSKSIKKLLLKMNSGFTSNDLESLSPNFDRMKGIQKFESVFKSVIVTTGAENSNCYDFYSRYFAPWDGIPEDHVTGSAHTVLAPFWSKITGKTEMLGRQCSKRGGDVKVKLREDGRVDVGGRAAVVMKGSLHIPS